MKDKSPHMDFVLGLHDIQPSHAPAIINQINNNKHKSLVIRAGWIFDQTFISPQAKATVLNNLFRTLEY